MTLAISKPEFEHDVTLALKRLQLFRTNKLTKKNIREQLESLKNNPSVYLERAQLFIETVKTNLENKREDLKEILKHEGKDLEMIRY